ncbi:hypothetical protein EYC98_14390 [Halieaceae bacterium IMCC14734]|uniref:DUF4131 domain-containing protein n=1 Tax=Candidatus Litorirhabdus singularis TaxID=2518993 RepID=A0ABT3TIA3_9GAMM|nr:hypothetical protein [Candidatus Litorirhabdus singularis]MCX2982048.1 hypothetical protein [Candidatus Litorirhabdus singularis]
MSESESISKLRLALAGVLLFVSVAVFAVRFVHAGAYAMPTTGVMASGIGALVLGGLLLWPSLPRPLGMLAMIVSPLVMFLGLYATMAELEEVISIYATNSAGKTVDLRLWVVDREDGAWVGMPSAKAMEHSLDGARLEMLRGGQTQCVVPALYEDRPTVRAIHTLKVEKYAVARASGAIGLYPLEAKDTTVALRLDSCPGG